MQKKWKNSRPIKFSIFFNSFILLVLLTFLSFFKEGSFVLQKYSLIQKETIAMALIIVFFDIMEFACLYKSYSMIEISYLQPIRFTRIIMSGILSYFFLNEKISFYQFIGISIIISGNVIMIYDFYKKKKKNN